MTPIPSPGPGFTLWHVTLRWQRDVAAALKPFDLTHVQFVLLATTLWMNGNNIQPNQASLAATAGTDIKMTSQVIRTLERKKLLTREIHESDTRARRLVVSKAGAALARQAIEAVEAVDRSLLATLTAKARKEFIATLELLR